MNKILVFSEEYQKITNGMSNVWSSFSRAVPDHIECDILLNFEHWMNKEKIFYNESNNNKFKIPIFSSLYYVIKYKINIHSKILKAIIYIFSKILESILHIYIFLYLIYFLKKNKYSAIYSHNGGWPGGNICRYIIIASYLVNVPNRIIIIHSHPQVHNINFLNLINKLRAKIISYTSTNIVTVSESVKEKLIVYFEESKIIIIFNGFDEINYKLKYSMSPGINFVKDQSELTIGFLGAIYHHKGAHVLLQSSIHIRNNKFKTFLFGGPISNDYKNYLMKIPISRNHNIIFLDYVNDIDGFYKSIDILVVPSVSYESFGMVILEAMYNKLPVICSNFGGMKEIVVDKFTGLIFDSGNPLHLARCIDLLGSNPELRLIFGKNGFERLKSNFGVDSMVKNYLKLCKL